jgi:spermidine synthase
VVTVFLASLSIAAAVVASLQRRFDIRKLIGITAMLGAILTVASIIQFTWLTELKYFTYGNSFASYMGGAVGLVSIVVAPAIICFGMTLPLVWAMVGDGSERKREGSERKREHTPMPTNKTSQAVGKLTAINTLAAAIGALVASFVLLPTIGLWSSFVLVAGIFCAAGFWLLGTEHPTTKQFRWPVPGLLLGLVFATVSMFAIGSPIESQHEQNKYGEKLIQRWNSAYGWIDVVQREKTGAFKIRQNLHYRFGTTGNNVREYRQAHIPLLLHPNPTDVMFVGLGTGLTAGGAVPHQDVKKIDAVELIPEVVEAIRVLADYNYNVIDHPKVEVFVDDARHHLLASERNYDVIVSDLFVPWESETGYLYTVEHFQTVRERLKPGGLFCQWLPLYQVGQREFKLIANSFASAFPNTTIWWGQLDSNSPVIAFIGTESSIKVDTEEVRNRIGQLKRHVSTNDHSISSLGKLPNQYIGDWHVGSGARLNTDEYPRVEFLTPISNRNREMIRGAKLEQFFDGVLETLPTRSVSFSGSAETDHRRRRARQRALLFGK